MNEIVTIARRCQQYAQPLSPVVSCGNDLYNTNSPNATQVTIVSNFSHTCACALSLVAATIGGWCLFRAELPIVKPLFKSSMHSKKYECNYTLYRQHCCCNEDIFRGTCKSISRLSGGASFSQNFYCACHLPRQGQWDITLWLYASQHLFSNICSVQSFPFSIAHQQTAKSQK